MKKKSDVLFLLPCLLGIVIFWIIPFVKSFYYAWIDNTFAKEYVGLLNIKNVINNEYFRLAMMNTLCFTIISVLLIMLLTIILSLLIARYAMRFTIIRSAFFLPVFLPSATVVMLWNAYMSQITPFNSLLILYLWKYLGLNIVILLTGIAAIPKDMIDAAKIDGAGNLYQDFYLILPNISPTIFFAAILSIMNSLKIYKESYLLYGRYPDDSVYMMQNYLDNHFYKLNYQNISSAAIIFAVIIYLIIGIIYLIEERWERQLW